MKHAKRIGSFICIIALCFTLIKVQPAHAIGAIAGQQFGAMIGAALVSLNLVGQVLYGATLQENVDAMHELQHFLGVPTIQELQESLPTPYDVYTFDDVSVSEALNTSIIKIRQGVTTIDGKVYDELWVSPEGAQKLKTNAFDFITKYNLISNDTSTLASGAGYVEGEPMYEVNGVTRSIAYQVPGTIGNYKVMASLDAEVYRGQYNRLYTSLGGQSDFSSGNIGYPQNVWFQGLSSGQVYIYGSGPDSVNSRYYTYKTNAYQAQPFHYDFVSGTIPAQEEIPDNAGLAIRIPQENLHNFYNAYPQYDVPDTNINIQHDGVDIDDLVQKIFSQVESMNDINAEWTSGEPAPVDPIENIDQNVENITQYQQDMHQQVDHMHQDVEDIHVIQQEQKQIQQTMQQDTSSIDSTLKDVVTTPGQSDIPSFKFDLRELFPFCIPFDIYRLLSSFDAEPQAPHVQLPIVIDSINFRYNLDLDFSAWNPVAQAMRTAELIVYAIGLAWATGKVIKW